MKNDMMQYRCPNCGGNIDPVRLICEYCGTRFYRDERKLVEHRLNIVHSYAKPVVLGAKAAIRSDLFYEVHKEEMKKEARERLTWKFAEALMPYIEFDEGTAEYLGGEYKTEVITGRLRVLPPGFKF